MTPMKTEAHFASLHEDLRADPLQEAIRDKLREMVEAGADPDQTAEAALVAASALMLDVEGMARTAVRLIGAGSALANVCPELQATDRDRQAIDLRFNH